MMKTRTKKTQTIKQIYLDWLIHQIEERSLSDLNDFIADIHAVEFYCVIPNDDNRVADGLKLRDRFMDELDYDPPEEAIRDHSCSVLEMLIALAERMDFILFDPNKGNQRRIWFWLFIDNLKLQKYECSDESADRKRKFNKIVLRKFVKREYQEDGRGGIFPLNNPLHDQRHVEIWYQMMEYINENYGF